MSGRKRIARIYIRQVRSAKGSGGLFPPSGEGREREILSSARIGADNITGFYECNGDRPFVLLVAGCVNNDRPATRGRILACSRDDLSRRKIAKLPLNIPLRLSTSISNVFLIICVMSKFTLEINRGPLAKKIIQTPKKFVLQIICSIVSVTPLLRIFQTI